MIQQQHMFPTQINIDQKSRERIIDILNQHLADTFDLYSQIKQAHWNVKGIQFYQLHLLFDTLAEDIEEYVDMIAERVTALGGTATGTTRMAAAASRLPEMYLDLTEGRQYIEAMVERYASYGANTREAIETTMNLNDAGTSDLFTEISRGVDKHLYFLESHIQA